LELEQQKSRQAFMWDLHVLLRAETSIEVKVACYVALEMKQEAHEPKKKKKKKKIIV
jgi:hypothetical protein